MCVAVEMTVGKDKEVTVKSKGAGGQGKVAAKVTGPSGKPVASKVWCITVGKEVIIYCVIVMYR